MVSLGGTGLSRGRLAAIAVLREVFLYGVGSMLSIEKHRLGSLWKQFAEYARGTRAVDAWLGLFESESRVVAWLVEGAVDARGKLGIVGHLVGDAPFFGRYDARTFS